MTENTEIDFKKIHSMDKSSIIEYIRGISKTTFKNSEHWNLGIYVFNCAAPWIEKGDIDVIKEVIKKDFSVIGWADELDHEIVFSRDLIILSLQEIYRQQNKSYITQLEYILDQKLDHALLEEAFTEKDSLEKFIEFGINKFSGNFIRSFPWQDYPNLQMTCFSKIPLKMRKQNKAFCLSFILGKEEFSINDFVKIPKEFKSDQLFIELIFNRFAYQKTKREWERVSRLEKFYKTTQDNIFWKDEFNLCSYLAFGAKDRGHIYLDFNQLDPSLKKSNQVKKLILTNCEVRNFHEIYEYVDKSFISYISFEERFYLYNKYRNQQKNPKNPFISALFEKNIFHLNTSTIEPQQFLWTKSVEKRYLEFLEKFDVPKEYIDS